MNALRRPPAQLALALQAIALVWVFHAALAVVPFARLRAASAAFARIGGRRRASRPLDEFVWAAAVAGRRVPRATCLARALGVQALLALHGHASVVRIGVARGDEGVFEAHAWVEAGTTTIVGGAEASRFTPLTAVAETPR